MRKQSKYAKKRADDNGGVFHRIKLEPLNDKQKQYISAIRSCPVVICTGVWGSSKTYIPTVVACQMLLDKQIENVIIARPAEGKGRTVGFLKGDANEKLTPWCAPVLDTMRRNIGEELLQVMLKTERIQMLALEHVKGRTWDNTFIIVDECEDLEPEVAKSLVGRHGMNSKMVITGDIAQKDIRKHSGLEYLLDVIRYNNLNVPIIDFDSWEYCVRSDEARMWGMAFDLHNKRHDRA
jgi:phosphate starvation-inducible PhoH-like protein